MSKIIKSQINRHYNKFVIVFIIFAVIIVVFTGYFAFAKTVITIIPKSIEKKINISISSDVVEAVFADKTVTETFSYSDFSSQTATEDGYATGTITIYNNYVAGQQLVATTRLLSKDGILFRTQEDSFVPNGSTVDVTVKADQMGKSGDIGPSDFEIVNLNSAKKDKIYGKSTVAMSGGVVATTVITQADIDTAKEKANASIIDKAYNEFLNENKNISKEQITMEISKQDVSPNVGDKAGTINVATDAKFYLASANTEKIKSACLSEFQKNNTNYDIQITDAVQYELADKNDATKLNINCTGYLTLSEKNDLIKKEQLINKSENQARQYLLNFEQIKDIEIKISPFWVKTTPIIKENIIIEIKAE